MLGNNWFELYGVLVPQEGKTFCLGILEQSCVVQESSLTEKNKSDLERTQKTSSKFVLEKEYHSYMLG